MSSPVPAKRQKTVDGDVVLAKPTVGGSLFSDSEPDEENLVEPAPVVEPEQPALVADEANDTQSARPGGKPRKVALYVAYVGAGYLVGMHYCLLSDKKPVFE